MPTVLSTVTVVLLWLLLLKSIGQSSCHDGTGLSEEKGSFIIALLLIFGRSTDFRMNADKKILTQRFNCLGKSGISVAKLSRRVKDACS